MKKELLEKLGKYGLSAGALIAATGAHSQITYTDINPDITVSGSGSYDLDLNNDLTIDFSINVSSYASNYYSYSYGSAQISVNGLGNNDVMNDSSYYAYALSSGSGIGNGTGVWQNGGAMLYSFFFNSSYTSFNSSYGNWIGATDKYLGLRVEVGGQTYYGWARLDIVNNSEFVIKDYAIQNNPGLSIDAGQTFALPPVAADNALNVVGADIANNGSGADLEVAFDMAANESTLSEYRIQVVKAANAGTFDIAAANTVSSQNFTAVAPTGANITTVLTNTSKDVDGDFIIENEPYRIFILSIADGTNAQINSLSNVSNEVTLTTPVVPSDPALVPVASDIDDNANGSDISVTFDAAVDESKVVVYRLIAVKTAAASGFGVNDAQSTPLNGGKAILPDGSSNYTVILNASQDDSDGDPIVEGVPYKIIIQSVADGVNANQDTVSVPSNEVTLGTPIVAQAVQNVELADVDDNTNGTDVEVSFDMAADETPIEMYRVFIIKSNAAAGFTLSEAMGNGNFTPVLPINQDITVTLNANSVDSDGDLITKDVPYRARVVSMTDTLLAMSAISNISNEITLDDPVGINTLDAKSIKVFNTGESIRITASEPIKLVEVYDLTGALVKSALQNGSLVNIATAEFSSGIYMVRTETAGGRTIEKVIIP